MHRPTSWPVADSTSVMRPCYAFTTRSAAAP